MDEAAPQAAVGMSAADIEQALALLDMVWGDEFKFGHDTAKGFWATRHGTIGTLATAESPEDLGKMLADQAGTRPS
jgi:hypothetical protein